MNVAYKDGQPTPAAHAFAKKAGVDVARLEKVRRRKANILSAKVTKKGRGTGEILAELLPKEIASSTGRRICTGAGRSRALRASGALAGRHAGRGSGPTGVRRHRSGKRVARASDSGDGAVAIPKAGADTWKLCEQRRCSAVRASASRIRKALDAATRTVPGARWREDKELLDTVVNLTEFPSVILGNFDPQFLSCPKKCWSP